MALNDKLLTFFIKNKFRGKDRLFSLLVKLGFRPSVFFSAKYGIKLLLSPNEYIDNIIIKEGFYESEVTEEILRHLKDGETFWDIGANIGIHSLAIKKTLPNATIYSFEPNPKTLNYLYDNVRLNNLDVRICGFALFEKAGSMILHVADGNSGMSTLIPWLEISQYSWTVNCVTTTGDALPGEGYKVPNVIKLDTEGSELSILKGCKNLLADPTLRVILFEAGNDLLENLAADEMAQFLKGFGFTSIRALVRNEKTHHNLSNFVASRN